MPLLIKNGQIITATDEYVADILCEGETITRDRPQPAPRPAGAEVIDATGKFVFPGFIDPHVHIYLPFMGTFAKDNYDSASRAALVGGTTTLIEMCCPSRQPTSRSRRSSCGCRRPKASRPATSRFTWASRGSTTSTEEQLREIVDARHRVVQSLPGLQRRVRHRRHASCTTRCGWPRSWASSSPPTARTKRWSPSCRSGCIAEGKTGPEWHEPSRPPRGRGRGRAPPHDVRRADRRPRLHRPHHHASDAIWRRPQRPGSAACTCGSRRSIRTWCSTRPTPRSRTSKGRST